VVELRKRGRPRGIPLLDFGKLPGDPARLASPQGGGRVGRNNAWACEIVREKQLGPVHYKSNNVQQDVT
jgi:hypothetical protein